MSSQISSEGRTPIEELGVLAQQSIEVAPGLEHVEIFTLGGLLTLLWHGDPDLEAAVVACGGGMGGLLGPAEGLYHQLGNELADQGIGMVRVGYRRPNDLDACQLDVAAAVEMAARHGGRRFVTMGHSFGGAVAIRVATALAEPVVGVVTFATQSAGCEVAGALDGRPLLLFHGDRDEILPLQASEVVREIAGTGELVVLPNTGHLMAEARDVLLERLREWLPDVLG